MITAERFAHMRFKLIISCFLQDKISTFSHKSVNVWEIQLSYTYYKV